MVCGECQPSREATRPWQIPLQDAFHLASARVKMYGDVCIYRRARPWERVLAVFSYERLKIFSREARCSKPGHKVAGSGCLMVTCSNVEKKEGLLGPRILNPQTALHHTRKLLRELWGQATYGPLMLGPWFWGAGWGYMETLGVRPPMLKSRFHHFLPF